MDNQRVHSSKLISNHLTVFHCDVATTLPLLHTKVGFPFVAASIAGASPDTSSIGTDL